MSARVYVLNGPNLNLLGKRQPEIYGHDTLEDVEAACRTLCERAGVELFAAQSNHEGGMVELIHAAREDGLGIVINAGAYTHTSVAILDALNAFEGPVMEVHISNVHQRESFRHHSYISARADGIIVGCGVQGYELAVQRLLRMTGKG
ncbi:type II 3-dehydroquinate dehydratase [Vannielia sp.]|uniref:type II 3-dehydroquinate dehydratase n=1 Tax=Vannielia sp. TaxID=2813045 RepID=UPI002607883F|nr:type II 3-dehydroquinate dehydratase [Vannielia sp.]MDF1873033.1 type II 3-dehydroquinate dehydratase [Vannielia sp.]